ncbi:MAG: hypothetical protein DMG59_09400 [Acidobacteria bacterium]|nr:MAG: hypothetical protein DMG59_09400 [Acidobacteriota bacterium]
MKRTPFAAVTCLIGAAITMPLAAQEFSRFTFSAGGGVTQPVGGTKSRFDTGWNFTAGAGVNFVRHAGIVGEFTYNSFGINGATLQTLQFPNGDSHIWAVTADPIVRLNPSGPIDLYLIGGGGVYHRLVEFTQPTVATVTAFDPFFGIFFPATVPANQVLRSFSVTKGGVNGGAGLTVRLGRGNAKLFAEARYHYMFTPNATTFVPVTFGLRW